MAARSDDTVTTAAERLLELAMSFIALISPLIFFTLAVSFLASGVLINIIQLLLQVLVRPFDRRLFYRLNYYPRYWMMAQLVFLADWWGGLEMTCHVDEADMHRYMGKEHAICVINHTYDIDWLAGFTLCDRLHMLGNCRAFIKKAVQFIPIIGSSMKMGGDVFLNRNWEKDKNVIGRQVTELVQYPSAMWLMLTAEGTRFTRAKHEASQKFARAQGLPELKHHLTPRTKGFTHTIPHLRGKIDAVYDLQLAFRRGANASNVGILQGGKYEAHFYINRIPLSSLPEGELELSKWIHDLYQKKDRIMDSFLNTGDFFIESGVPAVPAHRLHRRWGSILTVLTWAAITLVPIVSFLARLLSSGSVLHISLVMAGIALGGLLMVFMVRLIIINQGSAYGNSPAQNKTE